MCVTSVRKVVVQSSEFINKTLKSDQVENVLLFNIFAVCKFVYMWVHCIVLSAKKELFINLNLTSK